MRIVLLQDALLDLAWFRQYYTSVFPEGNENARKQFANIKQALSDNPFLGHPRESHKGVRELHIPRTPFTVIYRVTDVQIEVLRLWDERQGGAF